MPTQDITRAILVLRGQRVIRDRDLATIYGVSTGRLNEAIKRNAERFPDDFMLQLTAQELENLRSQFATSSWGGRRYRPFAFTEHGVIQAANVLSSPRAIAMGVHVVRAFVQLRELLASNKEFAAHDEAIAAILSAIRQLMHPPGPKRRGIGFTADLDTKK
ncbi:MAG: ORF6N domain-containing protein [Steroidobacteraceae bacterium]